MGKQQFKGRLLPVQGWAGLALIAVFWPLNWALPGLRTAYLFFPLWLGYILTVDGLVWLRKGSSLLARSPGSFLMLFLISAPAWWLFEYLNERTQNWEYLGEGHFTALEYFLLSSVSFSTVMPAIFESAELVLSFSWPHRFARTRPLPESPRLVTGLFFIGLGMLGATLTWPRYCYPFVWTSLVLILEPLNYWLNRPSLLKQMQKGDGRTLISLGAGALLCGFFWELWNYYSYPKWVYHTPGAQFAPIFEMPLLGYGGYVPFAWELYALRNLAWPKARELAV